MKNFKDETLTSKSSTKFFRQKDWAKLSLDRSSYVIREYEGLTYDQHLSCNYEIIANNTVYIHMSISQSINGLEIFVGTHLEMLYQIYQFII